ncbi:MAG: 16S rRNA (guanine(966)-N(2))-methyltransferase RsmD [Candidatus Izemoplasmatales bacterium]|nr:16S rRNA (guanine(966)-N(2))-methyltransferase RsmD [Candidatus Izemoplasmatales bacterium]
MLRVIAGLHRGIRLDEVANGFTRPTTDKNKETLFNILGQYFDGGKALDLFAGSGALGIEAFSRGMEVVVFLDKEKEAIRVIKNNLERLKNPDTENCVVLERDAITYLERPCVEPFDLILVDPPYESGLYPKVLSLIEKNHYLKDDGILVFESDANLMIDTRLTSFVKYRERKSGNTKFHFFQKGESK